MNILQKTIEVSGRRVMSGPFRSMILDPNEISWGDGDIVRKLLGVYEEELHDSLECVIGSKPSRVINLGCAEGYYAIGMSIRIPEVEVIAVDISPLARKSTAANSSLNGTNNLKISENKPHPEPNDFWMVDIEGGEVNLLSEPKDWRRVNILVELHEWTNRNIQDIFTSSFESSHDIKVIISGSRNPNKFGFLSSFSDHERWMAMSESRPETMRWMWMKPKI